MNNSVEHQEFEIIESDQKENTPAQNVKRYKKVGNNLVAEFWSREQAISYIKENSPFKFSKNWHDVIGFANFSWDGEKEIIANSTYHSTSTLIEMYENGLKY